MMSNLNLTQLATLTPSELSELILKQDELNSLLQVQNRELVEANAQLQARIKRLEEQLAKDSHNSHKPPSSDGFKKAKPKSLREKGKRPAGGQKGHAGHRLAAVSEPDEVISYALVSCPECQADLSTVSIQGVVKRQVFDLPPVRLQVSEHQAEVKDCPQCGARTMASFPEKVQAPTQYGERLKAQIAYLSVYQLIPQARLVEVIQDFYGQPISKALIQLILAELSVQVEPSLVAIRAELVQAAVAHADETGVRVAGLTHWWHVFATPYLTYYSVHPKRGQIALRDCGLLDQFQGCVVHDAFASYFVFAHCQHALCNAHLLRELTFVAEELQQTWAGDLKTLLLEIKAIVELAHSLGHTQLTSSQLSRFTQAYADLVQRGWLANPLPAPPPLKKPGRVKKSTPQNLLQRLENYADMILAFMDDFRIPFDNNLAERDLRMIKVQQKVSGCFRTQLGAEIFARIRSYVSTTRKQGVNVLLALSDALRGHPFIPDPT